MPLSTKLIDIGAIFDIWMPTKIKCSCIDIIRYYPVSHVNLSSCCQCINIFYFCCAGNYKSRSTTTTPLIWELIDIRLFSGIRMPTKIKLRLIYIAWYLPVINLITNYIGFNVNEFKFSCALNYILRSTCLLPLGSKLIDIRWVIRIRFPTIIKMIVYYMCRYIPISARSTSFSTYIHVFVFSSAFYNILNRYFIFWFIPLITPSIDIRRTCWIRYPTKIK